MTDQKEVNKAICRSPNTFRTESIKPGDFWKDKLKPTFHVKSIHQDAVIEIENQLNQLLAAVALYQG